MKKILKQGNIKRKWVAHCPYCNTEFEYEREDIRYDQMIHATVVLCPECENEIRHLDNPSSPISISTENFLI